MAESMAAWNERLQAGRSRVEEKNKRERRLRQLEAEAKKQRDITEASLSRLKLEQEDVEKLNSLSFSRVWNRLTGKLEERIEEEEREAVEAQLKYDTARAALEALEAELAKESRLYGEVSDAEAEYESMLQEKAHWIQLNDPTAGTRLRNLNDEIGVLLARLRETEEAKEAGEQAAAKLAEADEKLRSAQSWGTYDMLGGGMIATHIKHSRIDEARSIMHGAQHALRMFEKELADLNWRSGAGDVEIGGFLSFADYFFDGFLSDWIVQGRINDALDKVVSGLREVNGQLIRLKEEASALDERMQEKRSEHKAIVESV